MLSSLPTLPFPLHPTHLPKTPVTHFLYSSILPKTYLLTIFLPHQACCARATLTFALLIPARITLLASTPPPPPPLTNANASEAGREGIAAKNTILATTNLAPIMALA